MEFIRYIIDFILHIDKHLLQIVSDYQTWAYLILFVIIFMETGLVVTPFLPGDSLLFAAGAIAAMPGEPLQMLALVILLIIAAFSGDNTNYFIGRFLGHKVYEKNYRLIKREYLDKTHSFYEKYGARTIIIARFVPIVRTFAPFVAGVGAMTYKKYIVYCIAGAVLWVSLLTFTGYAFGNIPWIKKNFELVVFGIILISLLPIVFEFIKHKMKKNAE